MTKISHKSLSKRGQLALDTVLRVDMEAYFEAVNNMYDPETNPDGTFPLNVAENRMSLSMVLDKITQIMRDEEIPDWVPGYTSGQGSPTFRESVAEFFSRYIAQSVIDPDNLAFSAGATGVIEMSGMILADYGDVVAIPAPSYPVYKQDIGNIAGLERYDIITHHEIGEPGDQMLLRIHHLDKTKNAIEKMGKRMAMLILTNPDNPTGGIYTLDQLRTVSQWCMDHKVHLIVNEIYALTLIDTSHPEIREDYPNDIHFQSFAKVIQDKKSEYLHLWYAFSKDFCISGFRVGMVYSLNQDFIRAYANYNYSHLVSNPTQWILENLVSDQTFVDDYVATNQRLLTESYVLVIKTLKELGIPYVPSRGSMFVWLDLSAHLAEDSLAGENLLWKSLYDETGILLTPGEGFGHTKKGIFRMVYPYFGKEDLAVAMDRLRNWGFG